jgi:hypothetical protein
VLFFAKDDFALAYELIVKPDAILVGGALEAESWRAAQQAHAGRGLKNIGRKGAAVDVEFDAKIAGVGDPGDLISGVENDHLGYESNEYGTLCHFSSAPPGSRDRSACETAKFSRKRTIAYLREEFFSRKDGCSIAAS